MSNNLTIKLDFSGLEQLKKVLEKSYEVRVGIFGEENIREEAVDTYKSSKKSGSTTQEALKKYSETLTNADLGVIHEFGSFKKNIPARSFLRMPLQKKMKEFIKFLKSRDWQGAIEEGSIKPLLEDAGFKMEEIIDDGFATGGFGQWKANAPATIAKKGSSAPLIDIGELRRAITSKVVKK